MNILHITDLHLNSFESDLEFLRKGFYQEYIDRLYAEVDNETGIDKIDYLIITGDFVDIGKVQNFDNISLIIDYLCKIFSLQADQVLLTIGNHDFAWKEMTGVDEAEEINLKRPFINLRNRYNSNYEVNTNEYTLTKLDENAVFLSLDSTWNSSNGYPGVCLVSTADAIIESLRTYTDSQSTILIGCHFPIISSDDNFLAGEEQNYHQKHVWIKANILRDRIKRLDVRNIIWFHGDVHAGDAKNIDKETFILTSKFGGIPSPTEQRRQANIITIDDSSVSKITCNYEFPAHEENPCLGDWRSSKKNEIRKFSAIEHEDSITEAVLLPINSEVEEAILRNISDKKLYQFGRFPLNEDYISLGWIDISRLLTDKDLLNRITDKSYELIKSFHMDITASLFLGVEIIGGILASQLSVRFNVKNSIIPVRAKQTHYSEFEFSHSKYHDISALKDVIIFIDIISSGKTISELVAEIWTLNSQINIHVISIISNNIENRVMHIPNTRSYHTFCTELKIPVIKSSDMPDEEYVNPKRKY